MSAVDDILSQLPIDQLAQQLGEDPAAVETAAAAAVPALLGGLHANAQEPAGEEAIAAALPKHADAPSGTVDLASIDPADGAKIASHIFGSNQDAVVQKLGGVGGGASSGLVQKLIPMLAPIVLGYLAKQVAGKSGGAAGAAGGGLVGGILSEVLKGASQGTATRGVNAGSIIGDVLGGLLGKK